VTDDVIGWLTEELLQKTLQEIKDLPNDSKQIEGK